MPGPTRGCGSQSDNKKPPVRACWGYSDILNRNAPAGDWTFTAPQRLRLKPGLYYFTLERRTDEDLIFVGKFTVDPR